MLVWHDIGETRIGDLHKIASNYIDQKKEAEVRVMKDQLEPLEFRDDIF
jgi:5'-deoxynucleotidase YfbR-like HD superfamily hydrolase